MHQGLQWVIPSKVHKIVLFLFRAKLGCNISILEQLLKKYQQVINNFKFYDTTFSSKKLLNAQKYGYSPPGLFNSALLRPIHHPDIEKKIIQTWTAETASRLRGSLSRS